MEFAFPTIPTWLWGFDAEQKHRICAGHSHCATGIVSFPAPNLYKFLINPLEDFAILEDWLLNQRRVCSAIRAGAVGWI